MKVAAATAPLLERSEGLARIESALRVYTVHRVGPTGAKHVRASPAAAGVENGLKIARGRNTNEFLDEICAFPHAAHDHCVDALA